MFAQISDSRRIALLATALFAASATAQTDSPTAPEALEPAPETPAQVVKVDERTSDDDIADRLTSILESTRWYHRPAVEVENGVAFLSGVAEREEYRAWARELALKTEGVVAVVNRITVRAQPIWDFTPAQLELLRLWREIVQGMPLVGLGLLVLLLTLLASRAIARFTSWAVLGRVQNDILRSVARKTILVAVVIIGAYVFLRISGLTRVALTLLGGTGVAGLIIGFAFRDIAENFLASLLISIQRPFRIGDVVEINGDIGVVQRVTTRGTQLMDGDGNHIQIANATVYKTTIRNYTSNPNRRLTFTVGIGYDAGVADTQALILQVLTNHTAVLTDPPPLVLVDTFGAATITVRVYFWINGTVHDPLKVTSAVMRLTLAALQKAGVPLPDEAREVVFPQPVPVQFLEQAPAPRPDRARATTEPATEATAAEGELATDAASLHRQAMQADTPQDGGTLMGAKPASETA